MSSPYFFRQIGDHMIEVTCTTTANDHQRLFCAHFGFLLIQIHHLWVELETFQQQHEEQKNDNDNGIVSVKKGNVIMFTLHII